MINRLLKKTHEQQIQFESIQRLYKDTEISIENLHAIHDLMKTFTNAVFNERLLDEEDESEDFDLMENEETEIEDFALDFEDDEAEPESPESSEPKMKMPDPAFLLFLTDLIRHIIRIDKK